MNTLERRTKKVITGAVIIAVALTAVIGYRIYSNLSSSKERAGRATQGRAVAVETAPVSRKDITPVLSFSANLEPQWSAEISSKVDGRIDRLLVEEGDAVTSGMVLATLDTNELEASVVQAEGTLLKARAGLEEANLNLARNEALARQGAIAQQTLDSMRIKRDLAVGDVRIAEGNLTLLQAKLDNARILAPRSGVIVKRPVQAGYYTKAGSPIVTLADTSSLLAKAVIGEAQVKDIIPGTAVKVVVDALGAKEFAGTITRVSPAAAFPARTFTAEVSIPNPEGLLRSGLFAKALIPLQRRQNILVVPESALVMKEDQKTVFLVTAQGQAQQVTLTLGYIGDGYAEVLAGLKDGDVIVVAGHNKIKDGAMIQGAGGKAGGQQK